MAIPYDPDFTIGFKTVELEIDGDQEHDVAASAAVVAVDLISSARLAAKLDSVYTEYAAQYLVDNARPKKKGGKGPKKKRGKAPKKKPGKALKLTVKDCLMFVLKKGIPKAEDWPQLGSLSKPPSSHKPALVSMKGEVIETKSIDEACDLLTDQPVGAKLHVYSPQIDVGEGVHCGGSGEASGYVGLRDGIIVRVEKIQGKSIATVKLWYKNEFRIVNVAMSRMFARIYSNKNDPRTIAPTLLLVDFLVPRLSIN